MACVGPTCGRGKAGPPCASGSVCGRPGYFCADNILGKTHAQKLRNADNVLRCECCATLFSDRGTVLGGACKRRRWQRRKKFFLWQKMWGPAAPMYGMPPPPADVAKRAPVQGCSGRNVPVSANLSLGIWLLICSNSLTFTGPSKSLNTLPLWWWIVIVDVVTCLPEGCAKGGFQAKVRAEKAFGEILSTPPLANNLHNVFNIAVHHIQGTLSGPLTTFRKCRNDNNASSIR